MANVFTIPPGAPFLDTLVDALLAGRLVEGFDPAAPFALADVTLYLPTRRAARAIRGEFLRKLGRPLLLPRIRTLGDIDEDDAGLLDLAAAELPAAVPAMERQLFLTQLVLAWSGAAVRNLAALPDEELLVPASPADAARLAASLGALLDQVGTEKAAWSGLLDGAPGDLARYWQITLDFLKIVTEFWPQRLAERGLMDPGVRRDAAIRAEAARLLRQGAPAPVIAAGSTGSVPATAELLKSIAHLPNGAVVLPGLDQGLDEESWAAVGGTEPSAAGHPQYGLKLLLEVFGVGRADVAPLGIEKSLRSRDRFVSEAMRPAETTEHWSGPAALSPEAKRAAVERVGIVEAANEREEALAVAVLLREIAETQNAVAALVTPDRGLARRVAIELRRWGIDVDDSAGRPLGRTPQGIFARLVAEAALHGVEAETLLALLKHPLAAFGKTAATTHRAAQHLERAVLRGPRLKPGMAALRHALATLKAVRFATRDADFENYPSEAARGLFPSDWDEAEELAARVEAALAPLEGLRAADGTIALEALVAAHLAAMQAAADPSVFAGEAGEALALAFEDLQASAGNGPAVGAREYPSLFAALIERMAVRPRGGLDPRIHIWGTLEARLLSVDRIVLGGLNEGVWPAQTRLDPLLSRPMRAALSLEPPERRIGLAAHDFAQALGAAEVWLTRADRTDGEPKVASRWLQRLTAHAGEDLTKEMRARGRRYLALIRPLDRPAASDPPARPRPSPPVEKRPKKLSATRIETLIRDPYAIYAQYVLGLRPFDPLAKLPDARDRGNIVHNILEDFVRERPRGPFDTDALERLLDIGRATFAEYADYPEVSALWWPRFEKIAHWFVETEAAFGGDVAERHVEGKGAMVVTPTFTLSARADRLDVLTDGTLAIVDYKTGAPPTHREVRSLSPQLPLEALIARAGGFEGLAPMETSRIVYYRLAGRADKDDRADRTEWKEGRDRVHTLPETLDTTARRLRELAEYFEKPEAFYLSNKVPRPRRTFAGDYDHLARISEWVKTDQEEDDDFPVV